jgi:hypothetical protein
MYKLGDNLGNKSNPNTGKTHCVNGHEFTRKETPQGHRSGEPCSAVV